MFLTDVLGSKPGYVQLVSEIITEGKPRGQWFKYPEDIETIEKYASLRAEEDVWFTVNLYSKKERSKDAETVAQAVYMDADLCEPEKFRLEPSYSIETSPGKWHCYWVLDTEYPASEIQEAAHRISIAHVDDGCDKSGWIPRKLLRYPGTSNRKDVIPHRVKIKRSNLNRYTLEEINEAYADIELKTITVIDEDLPDELPSLLDLMDVLPYNLHHLYYDEVEEGGSWSERMWALQTELFKEGWSAEEVYVVSWQAKCNKYHPDAWGKLTQTGVPIPERNNGEQVLWREVLKAKAEIAGESETTEIIMPVREDTEQDSILESYDEGYSFLTPEERAFVSENRTFIDEYVDWVASRTDAAPTYSRSLAWVLLSCTYAEYGYVKTTYGKVPLNFFLLILGDTTYSRKSTAVNHFYYALSRVEYIRQDTVMVANDFTPEALNLALANRDGRVSLVERDEVQGLFGEILSKSYLNGLDKRLTALYDGKAMKTIRVGNAKETQKATTTIFNFIGTGIRDGISEVLTAEHFASGFLARFVWAITEPTGDITPDMVLLEQGEEDQSIEDNTDEAFSSLVASIEQSLGYYMGVDAEPRMMRFTDMAWERYNEWSLQITGVTDVKYRGMQNHPAQPSTERLRSSVLRAAALLALHERSKEVEYHHILHAIAQAEHWYTDMRTMADEISSSTYQKHVDDVEKYIAQGREGKRTKAAVFKQFASYRLIEVEEWLGALHAQGRIYGNKNEVTIA